jgi:hypothetical protein
MILFTRFLDWKQRPPRITALLCHDGLCLCRNNCAFHVLDEATVLFNNVQVSNLNKVRMKKKDPYGGRIYDHRYPKNKFDQDDTGGRSWETYGQKAWKNSTMAS